MGAFLRGAVWALFPLAVLLSILALVSRLAGRDVGVGLLAAALGFLALAAALAAALATLALVRREWWWAAGLLVLWPAVVPLYARRLRRVSREDARGPSASEDAQV